MTVRKSPEAVNGVNHVSVFDVDSIPNGGNLTKLCNQQLGGFSAVFGRNKGILPAKMQASYPGNTGFTPLNHPPGLLKCHVSLR
jgi:hypothetical protein